MIEQKKRKLLIGAVGLVKGSVRNGGKAMVAVCDEFEPKLDQSDFLGMAPFKVISLILKYGTEWGMPQIGRINKSHSELEVAVEIPMVEVRMLDEAELIEVVRNAVIETLRAVATKYSLNAVI